MRLRAMPDYTTPKTSCSTTPASEQASKQRLNHADFEHWARLLTSLGHHAKLIAPEVVRRFVKKGKRTTPLTPRRCARPLRGPT
jgi:hypothetical protein